MPSCLGLPSTEKHRGARPAAIFTHRRRHAGTSHGVAEQPLIILAPNRSRQRPLPRLHSFQNYFIFVFFLPFLRPEARHGLPSRSSVTASAADQFGFPPASIFQHIAGIQLSSITRTVHNPIRIKPPATRPNPPPILRIWRRQAREQSRFHCGGGRRGCCFFRNLRGLLNPSITSIVMLPGE